MIEPGLQLDRPALSAEPYWRSGINTRVSAQGLACTIGLFGPMRDAAGTHLDFGGTEVVRSVLVAPGVLVGQFLLASANKVMAGEFDPASSPATGTTYLLHDITPDPLPPAIDNVPNPTAGTVPIPPVWWWAESDELIVGGRANMDDVVYVWLRSTAGVMTEIPTAPKGAVGGCIVGRILVLLGCQSFTDPVPARQMTIRWSDRFDFADWTPTDINVSGEIQLDGGSRIVGGGVCSQGVVAWTDKRMALLTETGNIDTIFARNYVDGGRGLMSNKAWCEADGAVWWFDETRTLNTWAGGLPQQVPCGIRVATLERMGDSDVARAYLVANQEFGEVILWYPDPDGLMWTGLVYSYVTQKWSVWRLDRPAWGQRVGVIRNIGVDTAGLLYAHDLDSSIPDVWLPNPLPVSGDQVIRLADLTPFDWSLTTCMLIPPNTLTASHHVTQVLVDTLPGPGTGDGGDAMTVKVTGYAELTRDTTLLYADTVVLAQNQSRANIRVEGKAIEMELSGTATKTQRIFGEVAMVLIPTETR